MAGTDLELVGSIIDLGYSRESAMMLAKDLTRGWALNRATELARERKAAQEAKYLRQHHTKSVQGLGKQVLNIDPQQYWEMVRKYGYEAFSDRGFIRDMQRLCPETAVAKA